MAVCIAQSTPFPEPHETTESKNPRRCQPWPQSQAVTMSQPKCMAPSDMVLQATWQQPGLDQRGTDNSSFPELILKLLTGRILIPTLQKGKLGRGDLSQLTHWA